MRNFWISVVLLLSSALTTIVYAQDPTPPTAGGNELTYLQQIANNTYHTLVAVNNIPNYLNTLTQMALSWNTLEDTDSSYIVQTQGDFAALGDLFNQIDTKQDDYQLQISANVIGATIAEMTTPNNAPKILETMPNVNELFYPTIMGRPPIPKGAASGYNYLKNAAGLTLPHTRPVMKGNVTLDNMPASLRTYQGYYNTVVSVESYDAYVLSSLLAESQTGSLTQLQNSLVTKASQSSWLAQIATQELGKVLRDILLFQSQNYVLMTKLLQTQKQLLTAQVMTNSLLIAVNIKTENDLYGGYVRSMGR